MKRNLPEKLYTFLTGDDELRHCKDIPESACKHQPGNFLRHVVSLTATKTGDGLADPKLVLAWLLGTLGAPAVAIGLLVPVRESLALLPQLFTSATIQSLPRRKWVWAGGSFVQGLCVLAMGVVALYLNGAAAGWAIVGLLALFATARSVCSVSYKDVLGKTVAKQTRGTATGSAGSLAAVFVLLFGLLMSTGTLPLSIDAIAIVLMIAGGLWIVAGAVFSTIIEEPGAADGSESAFKRTFEQLSLLREDPQLVRFIAVRGLLTATALAPPFLLALAGQEGERSLSSLGPFVIASSLASVLSAYVWGRLSDQSSRKVLLYSAIAGASVLGAIGIAALAAPTLTSQTLLMAAGLFVLMIAYQGVRLGRSTHLVDMADANKRAAYTAISNTAIGVLLLAGGIFGVLAEMVGIVSILLFFAVMCLAAALLACKLEEVQQISGGE